MFAEKKFMLRFQDLGCFQPHISLTHGCGEDNDAEDIHLLAGAWTCFVDHIWRRSQLKVHRPTFGVAVIRDDIDEVGLNGFGWNFEYGNQVCFVLKKQHHV